MRRPPVLLSLVLLTCVACVGNDERATDDVDSQGKTLAINNEKIMTEQDDNKPTSPPAASGEVPETMLQKVQADLAGRLGHNDIHVHLAQAVTWPDGSMGCGKPGMMYTQMLVEGYHVIFMADGKQWDYRLSSRGSFSLCEQAEGEKGKPKTYTR